MIPYQRVQKLCSMIKKICCDFIELVNLMFKKINKTDFLIYASFLNLKNDLIKCRFLPLFLFLSFIFEKVFYLTYIQWTLGVIAFLRHKSLLGTFF